MRHAAMLSMALDREAVAITRFLETTGIPCIVLKGPALASWLYVDGTVRTYSDIDLLVPPSDFEKTASILHELGYEPNVSGSKLEREAHATTMTGPRGLTVDLHRSLNATADELVNSYAVLSPGSRELSLAGGHVLVCGEVAQLVVVVLHAAQHGAHESKPIEDLRRAAPVVTDAQVRDAFALAQQLGAAESFTAGLALDPELARRHRDLISTPRSALVRARALSGHRVPGVVPLARIVDSGGFARVRLILRAVFPTREFLESRYGPMSSRRAVGRRIRRYAHQVSRLPAALRLLWRIVRD